MEMSLLMLLPRGISPLELATLPVCTTQNLVRSPNASLKSSEINQILNLGIAPYLPGVKLGEMDYKYW